MEFPRHDYWSGAIPFSRGPSHPVKLNLCIIHSRWFLYHLRHQRSPISWLRLMLSSRNEHCDHFGTYRISEAFLYQGIMREWVSEGGRTCVCRVHESRELCQNQLKSFFETTLRNSEEPSGNQDWKSKKKQKGLFRNICPHFSEKTWSSETCKSFAQWHTAELMAAPPKGVEMT